MIYVEYSKEEVEAAINSHIGKLSTQELEEQMFKYLWELAQTSQEVLKALMTEK